MLSPFPSTEIDSHTKLLEGEKLGWKHLEMEVEVMFRVLKYKSVREKIPEDYSLTTLAQAQAHLASVKQACSLAGLQKGQQVRLKNGLLRILARGRDQDSCEVNVERAYGGRLEYRLVSKPNSEEKLTNEDCLMALAYAAVHGDVDNEVEQLVECAGTEILRTRMPFQFLGTVLHVCTDWACTNTLEKVLKRYPKSVDVYILDKNEDTALHNLPNSYGRESYEQCKRAACLLLGLDGVNANELLSKQNNYGRLTALCKALALGEQEVCSALLDAAKEILEEKTEPATISEASKWLTLKACGQQNSDVFWTTLHLAVVQKYDDIVTKILEFPGAKELNLTSLLDFEDNTPLHAAAMIGDPRICSMLLKYSMEINKDGGNVRPQNKAGETPLHIASTRGHTEVCEKLLEYGAPLDVPDKHGKYALTNAFNRGHKQVVEKLLDACLPRAQDAPPKAQDALPEAQDALPKAQDAPTPAKSEVSFISAKCKHSLINEQFECGLTPLHVAVAISSERHISSLLKAGAWVDSTSDDGRTPLHVATQKYNTDVFSKLLEEAKESNFMDKKKGWIDMRDIKKGWINMRDISGQTALHNIVRLSRPSAKDQSERSSEEESSERESICDTVVKKLLERGAWVDVQDCDGETVLHEAARRYETVVGTLLSETKLERNFRSSVNSKDKWIAMCDFSGETALHEAARAGQLEIVRHLLHRTESPADLLRRRDMENMTALDWAAKKQKLDMIDVMMRMDIGTNDIITKPFLMWNLKEHVDPRFHKSQCKNYEVKENQTSLLQAAVRERDVDIARELINKGADVPSLEYNDRRWLAQKLGKKASDQPTSEDTLGRKALVQGVATLLLNPYTETPITIGIFGSWGTGKSSFMLQVEEVMLHMVVKETFKKTSYYTPSHDRESSVLKFSRIGATLRCMVIKALKQRMIKADKYDQGNQSTHRKAPTPSSDVENQGNQSACGSADIENQITLKDEDDIIDRFPMELQSKHHQLFRDLALTDRSKLVRSHAGAWYKRNVGMNHQTLQDAHLTGYTPAVMTLHYNAWQYDNKKEASAGLAVEIIHQLESFMTPHQWLRMCWKYSWNTRPRDICVHLLLPAFLALVVVCTVLILWKFVPIAKKFIALCVPMGIMGVMWVFFKTSLKVIQPVTYTMLNNPKSIDHWSMLGYQHQVIHDIKFLKDQLCHDAHFGWKIISFLCQLFISNNYFMEGTWIWKQHPRLNNFRIVVFIDDLDRCDEKTILECLRATNLILGSCGISVVIGVDKGMVQRAITKEFPREDMLMEKDPNVVENVSKNRTQELKDSQNLESNKKMGNEDKHSNTYELADKYLQKIIQLPIEMPDPSRKHIECFLEEQLGKHKVEDPKKKVHKDEQKKNKRKSNEDQYIIRGIKEDIEEKQLKDEGNAQSQEGIEDGDPIVFRLILANYTPMEEDMLKQLCQLTTKEKGFPREWKQFLNYHRLAWTILSLDSKMKHKEFKGWQRKLILWIFICWNWRDQMDVVFENWNNIIAEMHLQEKDKNDGITLELCDIIDTYMKRRGWRTKEDINQNRKKHGGEIAPKAWMDLYKTLKDEYDIPMHCVEKFQQFRFHCKLNHLEINEHYKPKKKTHLKSLTYINETYL
ncbi:hypothetical protein GOP47_0025781 [Adiantum capillus-veneris]|uniref:KAP NTPase domain-containing protein n=1 Tax=Adiantum capillus-veneris TaxID=13818 RepID=A0A9D4U197_ADICA|nr:hypothetical protein GOP47_0025781 [Adiantum capillus-veneris]